MTCSSEGVAILNIMVRIGLIEEVTTELRFGMGKS